MKEFFISHIDFFIEIGFLICVILITLLRKKVKIVDDIYTMVLTVLPGYIAYAEKLYLDGRSKYGYVFNKCIEFLVLLTNESSEEIIKKYATKIDVAIENILSTPQKKGCDNNER